MVSNTCVHADHMISVLCLVYEDLSAGARAEVILISTSTEISTRPSGTDSGYYGDILGRHGIIGGIKWGSDSNTSNVSSNSGNHDSESSEEFILGTLSVPPEISWVNMDDKVEQIFMVCMYVCMFVHIQDGVWGRRGRGGGGGENERGEVILMINQPLSRCL